MLPASRLKFLRRCSHAYLPLYDARLNEEACFYRADKRHFHTASFEPDDGNDQFLDDASRFLHWARRLFDRLVSEHPTVARQEFGFWSGSDPFFFAKLKIYGARYGDIIPAEDASSALLDLSKNAFGTNITAASSCAHSTHDGWTFQKPRGYRSKNAWSPVATGGLMRPMKSFSRAR